VTAYVLIAIAWPILYFSAFSGPGSRDNPLPSFSPIDVTGTLADFLSMRMSINGFLWSATICDAIVLFAAVMLLVATVQTFDRCLGRMPEDDSRGWTPPVKKPPVYEAELIGEWEAG
jgi:hypothetical protein